MPLTLRYMKLADIPQVVAIDQVSFTPPWSPRSYAYEVGESTYSHMTVLESTQEEPPPTLLQRLLGVPRDLSGRIISYGGLWHIMDEAHISTIATHPDLRGQGMGEIVLAGMIQKSIVMHASYLVLEVRVSNLAAQHLYKKYEFEIVDLKKGYYHNNGEDAYDMRLNLENPHIRSHFENQLTILQQRCPFVDAYTQTPRGR